MSARPSSAPVRAVPPPAHIRFGAGGARRYPASSVKCFEGHISRFPAKLTDREGLSRAKMTHRPRSGRSARSALLPVATAALAIGIFIADTVMVPEISVAVLYVAVVLMAARFCRPPGVVLVGAGCIGLTGLSYFLSADSPLNAATSIAALGSTTFSIVAIGLTTFLTLQSQSAEATLREQASLLDLTHDSIVVRSFDDDVITYWS